MGLRRRFTNRFKRRSSKMTIAAYVRVSQQLVDADVLSDGHMDDILELAKREKPPVRKPKVREEPRDE